jgi:hypothetical protein
MNGASSSPIEDFTYKCEYGRWRLLFREPLLEWTINRVVVAPRGKENGSEACLILLSIVLFLPTAMVHLEGMHDSAIANKIP